MTLTELFTNIADAIRTKKGTSDKILASDFATEIENLSNKVKLNSGKSLFYVGSTDSVFNNINNYFDTSDITDFSYMFRNNTSLTEINNMDTSNGTNFLSMFYNCASLISTPKIDTSNGTNFGFMFYGCTSLTEINNMDTSNGTNFLSMFYNCASLISVPYINTSNGINFSSMFRKCPNLETVALIDTSKGTDFSYMFADGKEKIIPEIDTGRGVNFEGMCYACKSLTTVPLLDMSSCTNFYIVFNKCTNLLNLGGFKNIGKAYNEKIENYLYYKLSLSVSSIITHDSLMNVINNLYDLNLTYDVANGGTLYTQSLQLGSTNKAKLTAEEIAIATSKRMEYIIKEELNMQYIGYTKPILLVADEGKKIREINDVYIPATETEPEHIPYYTDIVFLADGITEQQAFEMYVEEVVE